MAHASRKTDPYGDNRWIDVVCAFAWSHSFQHEWFVAEAKEKEADVLFLGDDHVALFAHSLIYAELFAPLHCMCFGSLGDECEHLLWRLEHGELERLCPKVIVVSIGGSDRDLAPSTIIPLLRAIVAKITEKQPQAKLFIMKLLPSGRTPNERRDAVSTLNSLLEHSLSVKVIDVDPSLLSADGTIDAHDMFDFVHLTQQGYRKVFEPVFVAVSGALDPDGSGPQ